MPRTYQPKPRYKSALHNPPADFSVWYQPALIAAAAQKKELRLLHCWQVLREIGRTVGYRVEVWNIRAVREHIGMLLGIGRSQVYHILSAGDGKYWNLQKSRAGSHHERRLGLRAAGKVAAYLNPELSKTQEVAVPIDHIFADSEGRSQWNTVESLLLCLVPARHADERPVSLAQVTKSTGLSRTTLRRHFRRNPSLRVISNYASLYSHADLCMVKAVRRNMAEAEATKRLAARFRILFRGNEWSLQQQLPNTYLLPELERTPAGVRRSARYTQPYRPPEAPLYFLGSRTSTQTPTLPTYQRTGCFPVGKMSGRFFVQEWRPVAARIPVPISECPRADDFLGQWNLFVENHEKRRRVLRPATLQESLQEAFQEAFQEAL